MAVCLLRFLLLFCLLFCLLLSFLAILWLSGCLCLLFRQLRLFRSVWLRRCSVFSRSCSASTFLLRLRCRRFGLNFALRRCGSLFGCRFCLSRFFFLLALFERLADFFSQFVHRVERLLRCFRRFWRVSRFHRLRCAAFGSRLGRL